MSDRPDRVHETLVEALGDQRAHATAKSGWLAAPDWAAAIDRVRATTFPDVPLVDAFFEVGRRMGSRLLAAPEERLLRESLETLPPQNLFGRLLPLMGTRLRQTFDYQWEPTEGGGQLRIIGPRATPPEVTLGFLQALADVMTPSPRIRIARAEPEQLEFDVEW